VQSDIRPPHGSVPRIEASDDVGETPAAHVRCLGQTLTYVINEQEAGEAM
jgi:hypothetical protein